MASDIVNFKFSTTQIEVKSKHYSLRFDLIRCRKKTLFQNNIVLEFQYKIYL